MSIKFLSVGLGSYLLTLSAPAIAQDGILQNIGLDLGWNSNLMGLSLHILLIVGFAFLSWTLALKSVKLEKTRLINCLLPSLFPAFFCALAFICGNAIGWSDQLHETCITGLIITPFLLVLGVLAWISNHES
jgi:hypothetical protein